MPFKSKAQQRFMFAAEERGELKPGTARKWAHETKSIKKLPEKVAAAFRSQAQQRYFFATQAAGGDGGKKGSGVSGLPERVKPKGQTTRVRYKVKKRLLRKGYKMKPTEVEITKTAAFEAGVADAMSKEALGVDPTEFRVIPRFGSSQEDEISIAAKGHERRAKKKGGYGKEERATAGRYGVGGAALGAGMGALAGAGGGPVGAAIGAGVGGAAGGGLGALGGLFKGKERTALAKKMKGMSEKEKKRFIREKARDVRHYQQVAASM